MITTEESNTHNPEIELVCEAWYGKNWDNPDPNKRPGENMKKLWREYAHKAIDAIDKVRSKKDE